MKTSKMDIYRYEFKELMSSDESVGMFGCDIDTAEEELLAEFPEDKKVIVEVAHEFRVAEALLIKAEEEWYASEANQRKDL